MMIFRSGAVSAGAGEKFIIALNMRDGCLLCEGLGNADWNYSAPGYAGRCMSIRRATESLSLDEYQKMTAGIFCTSVGKYTLGKSPLAYKPTEEIIRNIAPTAKVLKIIKPIYNYKL
jgi:RNA-splicing ligase RtcB